MEDGEYAVVLGATIKGRQSSKQQQWASGVIKYEFRPDSIDDSKTGDLRTDGSENIVLRLPSTQAGQNHVFAGKAVRSTGPAVECALIYNQDTRTFTLERQNVKLDMKKGTKEVAPMQKSPSKNTSPTSKHAAVPAPVAEEEDADDDILDFLQTINDASDEDEAKDLSSTPAAAILKRRRSSSSSAAATAASSAMPQPQPPSKKASPDGKHRTSPAVAQPVPKSLSGRTVPLNKGGSSSSSSSGSSSSSSSSSSDEE